MDIQLPQGWRLGKEVNGSVTLFYKKQWVERLSVNPSLNLDVNRVIENPPARIYPALFEDGLLDFTRHKCDKGIWKLIEAGCISPEEGWKILPTDNFKRTAKRKGVWNESWQSKKIRYEFYTSYQGRKYGYRSKQWYDITCEETSLPKRKVFKSIWNARVSYARNECSLLDVAEYRLSAVLECIADSMTFRLNEGDSVYKEVFSLLTESKPVLRGFKKNDDCESDILSKAFLGEDYDEWEPVFYSLDYHSDSPKWKEFFFLLKQVCDLKISGYEARLRYTNGYNVTCRLEHARFIKAKDAVLKGITSPTKLIHVPFFRHLGKTLKKMSLSQCRDFLQKNYSELFSLGPFTENDRKKFFGHNGFEYGLYVDSGKIFCRDKDVCYEVIPYNFDKLYTLQDYIRADSDYAVIESMRTRIKLDDCLLSVDGRQEDIEQFQKDQEKYHLKWLARKEEEYERYCYKARKARKKVHCFIKKFGWSYRRAVWQVKHTVLKTNTLKSGYTASNQKLICTRVNKNAVSIDIIWGERRLVA